MERLPLFGVVVWQLCYCVTVALWHCGFRQSPLHTHLPRPHVD